MRRNNPKLKLKAQSSKLKIIIVIACGLLITNFLTGCAKKEIKNINSVGKNIICFGDSLTFGYGVSPGEDYPSVLSKMVDIPVINKGIDGYTSTDGLKRLDTDVLANNPLLVIIEFAGNDFIKKVPIETTEKNAKEMIDRIQAKGAMVALVDISAGGLFLNEYNRLFKRIANAKGAIFVPRVLTKLLTNPSMKSDFLHPNANGYKVFAQRVYKAIKPYLAKNAALRKIQE